MSPMSIFLWHASILPAVERAPVRLPSPCSTALSLSFRHGAATRVLLAAGERGAMSVEILAIAIPVPHWHR